MVGGLKPQPLYRIRGQVLPLIAGAFGILSACTGCSRSPEWVGSDLGQPEAWEQALQSHLTDSESLPPIPKVGSGRTASPNLATRSLTLQQVLQIAERRNPGLQAARSRWQAARDRAPAVSGLPDPRIRLNVMAKELVTRNGPIEAQYRISQKFPWFGKLDAKEKAALAAAGAAAARYRQQRLTLSAKVAEAFYDLYYTHRAIEITQGMIELLEHLVASVQTKYVSGQVNQQDLLKVQIEREKLQNKLDDQRDVEKATRARLNGLLNRPGQAPLGSPVAEPVELPSLAAQRLLKQAQRHRPELAAARFELLEARQRTRFARLDYYPDLTLGMNYAVVGGIDLMGAPDPGQDAYGFSLGFNLPIWQGKQDAALRSAQASRRAASRSFREVQDRTQIQLEGVLARIRKTVREKKLLDREVIPKARQALRSSEAAYVSARVDILDLLDSERSLLRFRLARARAVADVHTQVKELEQVVGVPVNEIADQQGK